MTAVRLVQLTDLHLLTTPGELLYGADSGAALRDAIVSIQKLAAAADALVITGDIAQYGDEASYQRVKALLASFQVPIFVIPGNHDDVAAMQMALIDDNIKMQNQTVIGGWRCLFLDSTVTERDHGFIDDDAMDALQQTLAQDTISPTLIAMHHSPTYECSAADCQLRNRQAFLQLLQSFASVKGVIAGHVHCQAEENFAGIQLMATPSTFLHVSHHSRDPGVDQSDVRLTHTIDRNQRAYRILDLQDDGDIKTEVFWF